MIVVCDRDGYLKTYLYFSWGLYYPLFFGDYATETTIVIKSAL